MIDVSLFEPAMESETPVDGKKTMEVEFQIYGKLIDPSQLEKAATVERQEQWSHKIEKTDKNAGSAVIRVRSINRGEQYIRTTKIKTPSGGTMETECPSSKDEFDMFMVFADQGMIKDRYTFPVDGRTYEIDVFCDSRGNVQPWVKIDLEITELSDQELTKEALAELLSQIELPDLPVDLSDVIILPPVNRDPKKQARVDELYETVFLVNNYHLSTDAVQAQVEAPEADVVAVECEPVWADAPEDATHYISSTSEGTPSGWYRADGERITLFQGPYNADERQYGSHQLDSESYDPEAVTVYPRPDIEA